MNSDNSCKNYGSSDVQVGPKCILKTNDVEPNTGICVYVETTSTCITWVYTVARGIYHFIHCRECCCISMVPAVSWPLSFGVDGLSVAWALHKYAFVRTLAWDTSVLKMTLEESFHCVLQDTSSHLYSSVSSPAAFNTTLVTLLVAEPPLTTRHTWLLRIISQYCARSCWSSKGVSSLSKIQRDDRHQPARGLLHTRLHVQCCFHFQYPELSNKASDPKILWCLEHTVSHSLARSSSILAKDTLSIICIVHETVI